MRRIQIEAAPVKNDVGLSVKLHYGYVYYYENARMNFCPKLPEQPVTWEEYRNNYEPRFHSHIDLLAELLVKNDMLSLDKIDLKLLYFKFSDGELWTYTESGYKELLLALNSNLKKLHFQKSNLHKLKIAQK